MFSHLNILVTVLLLTSILSFGFASMDTVPSIHGSDKTRMWVKRIVRSSRGPWIEGFKSILHTSESSCADEVAVLTEAIESGQEWALQMLDASSSFQSGLMKGNFRDIGMYDECVEVNEQFIHVSIRGKHCMVSLISMSPTSTMVDSFDYLRIFSSICVPSSCNETHVEQIVNSIIANTPAISDLELEVSKASCAQVGSDDFSAGEICTLTFFVAVVVFMTACTICDFARTRKPTEASTLINTLAKFSLYTNALAILSTKVKPDTLQAIEGIRVLSTCWIILGHSFIALSIRPVVNAFEIYKWLISWASLYIEAAPLVVETFFLVSGFFTAYSYLKAMKSGRRISWPMFYLHRYLRVTPSIAAVVLSVTFLAHRTGSGPQWTALTTIGVENCRENWWINFLYLQNLVDPENSCLPHTWYLAVDMQLFWISPIVIYPLYHWPKYGIGILGFFLLVSIVTPAAVLAINGYTNRLFTVRVDLGQIVLIDLFKFYMATYNRATAYFLGIFLGYDVATKKRQLTKVNVLINWTVTAVLVLFCACGVHFNYHNDFAYNRLLEVILALTLRPCWSIAIAWIIYACTHGYGGFVNRFLSWPFFRPVSRLSFSIYLMHILLQFMRSGVARTPIAFSNSLLIYESFIDLALSIVVAFMLTLFVEYPMILLAKIFVNSISESNPVTLARSTGNERQVNEAGV
ncbi:nose resistant to fluoxetine protein 6-like [Neodiprion virginianus]|uniref:nose resistant to fluoxetine protein 6-like n=1 Tax=Neodiprion virginianus TaxID=2961670 RepID=UPI001EE77719|nr:nose resistant to fluoxetine protein 6-like [Neodiprion virginianus]